MFEGLAWPKNIYSLILNLCHSGLSGYSFMLLHVCVCVRACTGFYVHVDRFFCLPDSPLQWVEVVRDHVTYWAALHHHHPPPPAWPHSSSLPSLCHPSPSVLVLSSLFCVSCQRCFHPICGRGPLMAELHTDGGDPWPRQQGKQSSIWPLKKRVAAAKWVCSHSTWRSSQDNLLLYSSCQVV